MSASLATISRTFRSELIAAIEDVGQIGDADRVMAGNDQVIIQLSRDEVLVLFEWLHRFEVEDGISPFAHPAEQVSLWNLSAVLERELAEPFSVNYRPLVKEARERLAGDHSA